MRIPKGYAKIVPPAVSGWSGGQPAFEGNARQTQAEKTGRFGMPGVYDQMVQQWGTVRSHMEKGRTLMASLDVEQAKPERASPVEADWNTRAMEWIRTRCGVQGATPEQTRYGLQPILEAAHDLVWYGFTAWVPSWAEGDLAVGTTRGRAVLQPLIRSAVLRWWTQIDTLQVYAVDYQGSTLYQRIPYEQVIHLAWQGQPGELYGQGNLRALVGPFQLWRGTVTFVGKSQASQAGRLMMVEKGGGEDDMQRLLDVGDQFDAGALSFGILPAGTAYSFEAATSAASDPTGPCAWADAQADRLFASRNSSLVASQHGSRAVADNLSAEDQEWATLLWNRAIGETFGAILGWLARETGYDGQIWPVRITQAEEDAVAVSDDVAGLTSALSTAVASGLIQWSPADEVDLRDRIGWSIRPATTLANPAKSGSGCTCGADHDEVYLSDDAIRITLGDKRSARPYMVRGRDGEDFATWREAATVEINGVEVQPERVVAWLADDRENEKLIEDLGLLLGPIFDSHRDEIRAAVAAGASARQLADLRTKFVGAYLRELADASKAWVSSGIERARAEAEVQVATSVPAMAGAAASSSMAATVERLRTVGVTRSITQAAEEMASRVQGDALASARGDVLPEAYVPRVTTRGLIRPAIGPLRKVQESAQLVEASQARPDGLVVVAFVRSAIRDGRLCDHCAGLDRARWVFPRDEQAFLQDVERNGPPDSDCEGGESNCRCRLVPVYGRIG